MPSSSNDVGDLVFDTTAAKLKVFDGSSYALAGSSVNGTSQRFRYVATAGQTTFSGNDANGNSLTYDVASGTAFADIYLNGVKLELQILRQQMELRLSWDRLHNLMTFWWWSPLVRSH